MIELYMQIGCRQAQARWARHFSSGVFGLFCKKTYIDQEIVLLIPTRMHAQHAFKSVKSQNSTEGVTGQSVLSESKYVHNCELSGI